MLKLKIGHLNFSSRPVFFPIRGGSAEIPPNWLIVVQGKGNKYRLILMNSQVRDTLANLCSHRASDEFVFDKNANEVNDYALRWGFEEACARAKIAFGETVPGGIIWHDLRRTFATRLISEFLGHSRPGVTTVYARATRVVLEQARRTFATRGAHEYDIQDLYGHSKPEVTIVYARATQAALEAAVEKLIEPLGQVVEFQRKAG